MSDQQRMLLAAVLMAVVLFLSWTLTNRGNRGETAGQGPPAERQDTAGEAVQPPDNGAQEVEPGTDGPQGQEELPEGAGEGAVAVRIVDPGSGEVLVSGEISLLGGGLTVWELEGYRNLDGGDGERVDLGRVGLLAASDEQGLLSFATDAADTVVVSQSQQTVRLETAGGWREYTFTPGSYAFDVRQDGIESGVLIGPGAIPVTEEGVKPGDYFKAVWQRAGDMEDEKSQDLDETIEIDEVEWAGVRSKYFTVLLVNTEEEEDVVYRPGGEGSPGMGIMVERVRVYAGPVDYKRLQRLGIGAERMVDFGWPIIRWIGRLIFWFISVPLGFIGNWGVRIILLTMVLKTMLWPLTTKSFTSMQKMKEVQPRLKELQEKYKTDPKRQQMEMQKLYKEEGVNPLGGCLPMLLQMPFFFAMYRVLSNLVELRGADFILWIDDLSKPEILLPFGNSILGLQGIGLLAVLMGVSMFIQQKMSVSDPSQKTMVYVLPIVMTWLFMRFPAGLTLYWFVNNLLTIGQQELIKKRLEAGQGSG